MSGSSPAGTAPGSVGGPGQLEVDAGSAHIVFRRLLRHPIEDVWAAVTDPAQLAAWFMTTVRRESSPGGRLEMDHPGGVRATGRVIEWQPPRVYAYEWNLPPGPNVPHGEASVVRWELTPDPGGTLLVLTHRRLTPPTAQTFVRGLRTFLDRLEAHLDGTPMPYPSWLPR